MGPSTPFFEVNTDVRHPGVCDACGVDTYVDLWDSPDGSPKALCEPCYDKHAVPVINKIIDELFATNAAGRDRVILFANANRFPASCHLCSAKIPRLAGLRGWVVAAMTVATPKRAYRTVTGAPHRLRNRQRPLGHRPV